MAETKRPTRLVKLDGTSWGFGSGWFVLTAMSNCLTDTLTPAVGVVLIGILGILRLERNIISLQGL